MMSRKLAAALLGAALLGSQPTSARADSPCPLADAVPTSANEALAARAVVCLVNVAREDRGLRPVRSARGLRMAAEGHSRDMVARLYFEHRSPEGLGMVDRVSAEGYFDGFRLGALGEALGVGILAYASPRAIVQAWLDSRGHRAILLGPRFLEIGVGVEAVLDGAITGSAYTAELGRRYRSGS